MSDFDSIYCTQQDLEGLLGAAHVTVQVINKRYQAALAKIEELEQELANLKGKKNVGPGASSEKVS